MNDTELETNSDCKFECGHICGNLTVLGVFLYDPDCNVFFFGLDSISQLESESKSQLLSLEELSD